MSDRRKQIFEMLDAKFAETTRKAYANGQNDERQRIIKLLEEAECQGEDDWCKTIQQAIALIKGEHKHDIDVFGAPCACGTHHEYCNNCDWVEPCEIDGENN